MGLKVIAILNEGLWAKKALLFVNCSSTREYLPTTTGEAGTGVG